MKWVVNIPALSESELRQRFKAYQFILYIGNRLRFDAFITGKAAIILHRYLTRVGSTKNFHDIAVSCLFLAAKLTDSEIAIGSFADLCIKPLMASKEIKDMPIETKDLKKDWIDSIYYHEEMILAELNFDIEISDPYMHIKEYFAKLPNIDADIKHLGWIILSDCLASDLCVRHSAGELAFACILAAMTSRNQSPDKEFWKVTSYNQKGLVALSEDIKKTINLYLKE